MEEDAAERLRRRLYAPGATEDDVDRFRALRATSPPVHEEGGAVPDRRRRPRRSRIATGALVLAVVATCAVLAGVRGAVTAPAGRPTAGPTAAAPLRLALRPVRPVGADEDAEVDALFDTAQVASSSAADDFGARVMLRAAPGAAQEDLERTGSGGVFDGRTARVALPGVRVRRGDLLVLSVVARRPARIDWRFLARASGTRTRTVLLARSSRVRIAAGALRITRADELDGLVIDGAGSTVLRYRYALYRHRAGSPLESSASAALYRCGFDRLSGETRCAREG